MSVGMCIRAIEHKKAAIAYTGLVVIATKKSSLTGLEDSVEKRLSGGNPQLVGGAPICRLTPEWEQPEQVRDSDASYWGDIPQHDAFQRCSPGISTCNRQMPFSLSTRIVLY
jgi:hypothetical protein